MENKKSCQELVEAMVDALNDHVIDGMEKYWSKDMIWRGPGGIGTKRSLKQFQDEHQRPFLHAFPDKKAFEEVRLFDDEFAASTGYQEATHAGDWLGIPATGKKVKVRYMDIWRAENNKLVENWVLIDIIDFMEQVGIDFMGIIRDKAAKGELFDEKYAYTGPNPIVEYDGEYNLLTSSSYKEKESEAKDLVEGMVDALNNHVIDGMEKYWSKDMAWIGPAGIGTKPSLKHFQDEHQRPFLHAFPDKTAFDEVRLAEGQYAACVGYQEATHNGDWLGIPATGKSVRVKYMDIWRSENNELVDNWVIIDILDFMQQVGIDPFKLVKESVAATANT